MWPVICHSDIMYMKSKIQKYQSKCESKFKGEKNNRKITSYTQYWQFSLCYVNENLVISGAGKQKLINC